jgi:DNA polymerase-3 subunit delta'
MTMLEPTPGFLSLGQPVARQTVLRAAAAGRLQGTLLIHGPVGAATSEFVDDLLALLFCTDADALDRPCNRCRGCTQARSHAHPDLVIGSPEAWRAARSTGESIVGAARRWLLENAGAPIVADRRVILLEHVDQANEQTQNALLKVLEEPGPRQMFVLVADEPARLLPTIRSRAQSLRIGRVPRRELVDWLVERRALPIDQADALARIAGGLPGAALAYVDDHARRLDWWRRTQLQLVDLLGRGRADRFAMIRDLLDDASRVAAGPVEAADVDGEAASGSAAVQRGAAISVIDAWLSLSRDLLVANAGRATMAPALEMIDDLPRLASRVEHRALAAFVAELEEAREALRQNAAPLLAMQMLMLRWPFASSTAA